MSDIHTTINAIKSGGIVVVLDDADRENEGDLFIAAEYANPEIVAFYLRNTTGILCVPMTKNRAIELELSPMVAHNTDRHQTAFTVTCDHISAGTGVSAANRCITISKLAENGVYPSEFNKPGHIFPLVARDGGILERRGHTEAMVDLLKIARMNPVGLISELSNDDGTMKNREQCLQFAQKYQLPIISVQDICDYRINLPVDDDRFALENCLSQVELSATCQLPIKIMNNDLGIWDLHVFCNKFNGDLTIALVYGDVTKGSSVLTRIHSACFTGDILGSLRCDCRDQLHQALAMVHRKGNGVLLYSVNQEGRGIGLINKIKSYKLQQDNKVSTYSANKILGFAEDLRSYDDMIDILNYFSIQSICLLTNDPGKITALEPFIETVLPIIVESNIHSHEYLEAKREYQSEHDHGFETTHINLKNNEHTVGQIEIDPDLSESVKLAIVRTSWNEEFVEPLTSGIKNTLTNEKVNPTNITEYKVPGSYEIPLLAKKLAQTHKFDAIITVGVLIKGETMHFELISTAVANGVMQAQLETGVPIIYGVLSCYTRQQAYERCQGPKNLSHSLAYSSLAMVRDFRDIGGTIESIDAIQPCGF
eukprot:TRINITY_DN8500_c0_g1_i1.p1 TRINITY_DN8500_c0_g1~~TRINITY_DN8500_c0_g1_i1.p1  ORF type:complete len:621 (+),score=107.76 TRINITY_DN8500_c0_g1_i1:81-1865(+)